MFINMQLLNQLTLNYFDFFREGTAKFADMENTSSTLGRHQRKKSSGGTLSKKKNVWDPSVSFIFSLLLHCKNRYFINLVFTELKFHIFKW